MKELDFDQQLVKDLAIPPRPQVVTILFEEMSRDHPDLNRVAKQIATDVGLAGAMLKAVNSPQFGLGRKVSSVPQAISVMGFKNVANIATALVIKNSLGGGNAALERFWDTAEKVALISARLARQFKGIAADEAYTVGLFHDVGIPLLMKRFDNYREVLMRANSEPGQSFTAGEDAAFSTNHTVVGFLLARSWGLSATLCEAIRSHHDMGLFVSADPVADLDLLNHVALIHLAEHVQHLTMRDGDDLEWDKFQGAVMCHFGLSEDDLLDIVEDAQRAFPSRH